LLFVISKQKQLGECLDKIYKIRKQGPLVYLALHDSVLEKVVEGLQIHVGIDLESDPVGVGPLLELVGVGLLEVRPKLADL
jgi:hypothetical protein